MGDSVNFTPERPRGEIAVVIPCLKPDERLLDLVRTLSAHPFGAIVVVNDGSPAEYDGVFAQLEDVPRVKLLKHVENRGTGRACKTGFEYATSALPDLAGVVTADADGQHSPRDIVQIAEVLAESGLRPVWGMRTLGPRAPLRSRVGNAVTRRLFQLLSGCRVSDTQCGLRGIPARYLAALCRLRGERFESVTATLAYFCQRGLAPLEVPIETIYLEQNRTSHFRPIRDSLRIYGLLARIYAPALISAAVDLAAFAAAYLATANLAAAILTGRGSLLAEDALHRRLAYGPSASQGRSGWRRCAEALATGAASLAGIWALVRATGCNVFGAKCAVEFAVSICAMLVTQRVAAPPQFAEENGDSSLTLPS